MKHIAVYPGTFDPFTNGHFSLIQRAAKMFDQLIVAVATNSRKKPAFPIDDRVRLAREVLVCFDNVTVEVCEGLLVDFASKKSCQTIIRGLRAVSDFDYEFQLAGMNHAMESAIETVFLPAIGDLAFISSTMVREIVALGGNPARFVPAIVNDYLINNNEV
jgi:pantetheine-phosphate adenylyltransferase